MALIRCNQCGSLVSDSATECPKCHAPLEVRQTSDDATQIAQQPEFSASQQPDLSVSQQPIVTPYESPVAEGDTKQRNMKIAIIALSVLLLGMLGYGLYWLGANKNSDSAESPTATTNVTIANETPPAVDGGPAKPDGHYKLKGAIGQYGVTMQMDVNNGNITGYYNYNKYMSYGAREIINGTIDNQNRVELQEIDAKQGHNSGYFNGHFDGTTFSGTYNAYKEDGSSKTYSFELSAQ